MQGLYWTIFNVLLKILFEYKFYILTANLPLTLNYKIRYCYICSKSTASIEIRITPKKFFPLFPFSDHKKKKSKFEEDYYQSLLRTNKFGTEIKCIQIHKNQLANFSSHNFLINNKFEVEWYSLVEMRLNFTLITVTSRQLGPNTGPECFRYSVIFISLWVFEKKDL